MALTIVILFAIAAGPALGQAKIPILMDFEIDDARAATGPSATRARYRVVTSSPGADDARRQSRERAPMDAGNR